MTVHNTATVLPGPLQCGQVKGDPLPENQQCRFLRPEECQRSGMVDIRRKMKV